jgi:hypothetical protein
MLKLCDSREQIRFGGKEWSGAVGVRKSRQKVLYLTVAIL